MKAVTVEDFDKIVKRLPRETAKIALRNIREIECYPYINRGELWYSTLTELQKAELQVWYTQWLNVTDTFIKPTKPTWLK